VARRDGVFRVNARRQESNRTVIDFDGIESEWEQLLEPRPPVFSLT
jgi:hypothetical protein